MQINFRRKIKAQIEIFDDDTTRYLMFCGGFGAGKTAALFYKGLKLSYLNRGKAGGLLVPSLAEFKRDFLPMALDVIGREIPGAYYRSNGQFGPHFMFPWSKAPLFVFTAERPVKGPNLGWGLINEFSMISWKRIWEFLSRRRVPQCAAPQIIFAGTPEDEFMWLDKFIEKHTATGRLKVHYATSFENPFNDKEYAQELLENLDKDAAEIFVYGRPGRIGKDYFYYAYKPQQNDFPIEYDPDLLIHATLDFNVGRMSCGFAHMFGKGRDKQIGYFDELLLKSVDADTEAMGRAIIERYGKQNVLVTCDASGKARATTGLSDVKILERLGLKVRYSTANPRIRRSQIIVNGLFSRRRILINAEKCPVMKRDLLRVEQGADFEMDKSNPELTHMADGLRYLAHHEYQDFLERDKGKRIKVTFIGGNNEN